MLGLSVVILSYNRREALARTLEEILARPWAAAAQIIVVDNASGDGSAAMVRERFPGVELVALPTNTLVAGFNRGAERAERDVLLILDDDSWPDVGAVESALDLMERRPEVGGVMLHRRHPRSGKAEWPFDPPQLAGLQEQWPDMGCGNIVRRRAWNTVGGYEEGYVLYRNDTDLALKLLGAGYGVVFNPRWQVFHDSPAATHKSDRWLRLSTRNWMWLAKRHGRGFGRVQGMLLGWLHAHRLAGFRVSGHWSALKGAATGLWQQAPALPERVRPSGEPFRRLLSLKARFR